MKRSSRENSTFGWHLFPSRPFFLCIFPLQTPSARLSLPRSKFPLPVPSFLSHSPEMKILSPPPPPSPFPLGKALFRIQPLRQFGHPGPRLRAGHPQTVDIRGNSDSGERNGCKGSRRREPPFPHISRKAIKTSALNNE